MNFSTALVTILRASGSALNAATTITGRTIISEAQTVVTTIETAFNDGYRSVKTFSSGLGLSTPPLTSSMAHAILGLNEHASKDEVRERATKLIALTQKAGSPFLAAKVSEAALACF